MSNNLLLEVDEAMRWERIEKLWQRYGNFVLAFILLTIVATALTSGWNAWNDHVRSKDTATLVTLLEDKNFPDNIKPEALHMRAPLRGMALINGAGAYMQAGKTAEAAKLYEQAANDKSIPREIRALALLMQARLLSADTKSQADLEEILKPVLKDKKSPWQSYALMEAAAYAANRKADFPGARAYLKQILDKEDAAPSLRAKAEALDRIYAAKEKPVAKKANGDS
jgi:hypothetical protein